MPTGGFWALNWFIVASAGLYLAGGAQFAARGQWGWAGVFWTFTVSNMLLAALAAGWCK